MYFKKPTLFATEWADKFHNALNVAFKVDSFVDLMAASVSFGTALDSLRDSLEVLSACQERLRRTLAVT